MSDTTYVGSVKITNYAPDSDGLTVTHACRLAHDLFTIQVSRGEDGTVLVRVEDYTSEEEATFVLGETDYE